MLSRTAPELGFLCIIAFLGQNASLQESKYHLPWAALGLEGLVSEIQGQQKHFHVQTLKLLEAS